MVWRTCFNTKVHWMRYGVPQRNATIYIIWPFQYKNSSLSWGSPSHKMENWGLPLACGRPWWGTPSGASRRRGVNMKRQRGEARKTRTTRLMMTEMLLCHLYYTRGCWSLKNMVQNGKCLKWITWTIFYRRTLFGVFYPVGSLGPRGLQTLGQSDPEIPRKPFFFVL